MNDQPPSKRMMNGANKPMWARWCTIDLSIPCMIGASHEGTQFLPSWASLAPGASRGRPLACGTILIHMFLIWLVSFRCCFLMLFRFWFWNDRMMIPKSPPTGESVVRSCRCWCLKYSMSVALNPPCGNDDYDHEMGLIHSSWWWIHFGWSDLSLWQTLINIE